MTEILAGMEIQLLGAAQHVCPSLALTLGHILMTEPDHENQVWRGGSVGSEKCWPICRGWLPFSGSFGTAPAGGKPPR